jgi:peptidoglycan/LPS O-acetylase OafA/YrhL
MTKSIPAETPPATKKVYFKNLDGIRCFAALMVILQHVSDYKNDVSADMPNAERSFVSHLGFYGVTLFFVLSGYLIFYLLFAEKKATDTVKIRDFYMRRVLRIWPLYFGFGLLSILGIDLLMKYMGVTINTPVTENLFYLFTFSINIQMIFATINRGMIELYWSVCIEEQFYLFAPWLVKKGSKIILPIIFGLIAVGIGSKILLASLQDGGVMHFNEQYNPLSFFTTCWFDAFGFGILAAYIYFHKNIYERVRPVFENKILQGIALLVAVLYVTNFIPRPEIVETYLFSTVPALLFAYIILAASTGNFIFNLETNLLKRLGRYSYGIYVFHAAIAQLTLFVFLKIFSRDSVAAWEGLFPLTCIVLTCIIAGLSYEFYEKRFLKIKKSFTVIQNQKYN